MALMAKIINSLPFKEFFAICLAVNFIVGIGVVILASSLPPVVPLLYGLPVGEEQLAPKIFLVLPCLVAIILTLSNAFLAINSKDAFIHKVLLGICVAVTLLASITTVKIFFLVK